MHIYLHINIQKYTFEFLWLFLEFFNFFKFYCYGNMLLRVGKNTSGYHNVTRKVYNIDWQFAHFYVIESSDDIKKDCNTHTHTGIYLIPLPGCDTRSIFKQSKAGLNLEFLYLRMVI